MRPFTLGTMYWTNPNYSLEQLEEDMREIKDNNMSLIRCFVWWEKVEDIKGQYEFSISDRLFKAAENVGIEVMATIGFYPPLWLVKELDIQGKNDPGRYPQLDRKEVSEPLSKYIKALVERYKDSSALRLWNVWNEPTVNSTPSLPILQKFSIWLKNRYSTYEDLYNAWRGEHNVFNFACPQSLDELSAEWLTDALKYGTRGRTTPLLFDYHKFTQWNLTQQIGWLVDEVKALDSEHPTHANPCSISINPISSGRDNAGIAGVLDTVSASIHSSHDYHKGKELCDYFGNYMFVADQAYSWTHGKKLTCIGELQAGTTICHPRKYTPDAKTIKQQLWQALGSGLDGVLFWEWQSWRAGLFEVGEFSLRNASDGGPTERSEEAKEFGRLYNEHSELFTQVERQKGRIAILYSYDTCVSKLMQQIERPNISEHAPDHNFALFGCYRALTRANLPVEFVYEDQVEAGCLDAYDVLYLPSVEIMRAGVAQKIQAFVENGGAVYADGRMAFLDEHMYLRHEVPGHGLAKVFGAVERDFVALPDVSIETLDGKKIAGHIFAQYLGENGGKVVGTFPSGRPAVLDNNFGKGKTRIVGTGLCRRLREYDDKDVTEYIVSFAREAGIKACLEVTSGFVAKVLNGPEHDIAVVTNCTGQNNAVEIKTDCREVECIHGNANFDGKIISRDFERDDTAVFILRK